MRRAPRGSAVALVVLALLASCGTAQDIAGGPATTATTTGGQPAPPQPAPTQVPPSPAPSPTGTAPPAPDDTLPAGFGQGPPGRGLSRFYTQQVTWTDCGDGDTCASVWVPLDYAHPDGRAITIKAKRQPASGPGTKAGTLFINPGGPGGSGIDYLSYISLDASITDVYDVVGFDPRGVGQSTPVECLSDDALDVYVASDPSPDTPEEISRMEQLWTEFTQGCVAHSGPLLAHVSTIEAARDMDILRAVVKDRTFNYYGASYGTYLGATYAALFPRRVHRMVLDGAIDPKASPHTSEVHQAGGFQTALTAYLTDCVSSGNCPLGSTVPVAQQQVIQLLASIDQHPLPTSLGRELTEGLAFLGFIVPLYSRANWPYETQALEQALEGNGDTLLLLADQYTDRDAAGHYSDNALEVQSAVNCLDHPEHESVAGLEAGKGAFLEASPVFGPVAMWWPYACSNWPVRPSLPVPDYSAPGAPPIVVVGTTRDPATPYQQAVRLSQELDSGVLLSRDGDGHTAYSSGNPCINDAVNTYLVSGKPPKSGTMC
ncbi:MAG: alpha/beta hydrolase [Nocardioidaceae bacterium]